MRLRPSTQLKFWKLCLPLKFSPFAILTYFPQWPPSSASHAFCCCCSKLLYSLASIIPYFCLRHFTLFTSDTTSMLLSSHLMHICIACRLGFAHLSCYTYSSISSNKWKHSIEMYLYSRCARGKRNTYYRISASVASSTYIQFSNEIHFAIKLQTSHSNLLKTKYLFLETFQAKKNN